MSLHDHGDTFTINSQVEQNQVNTFDFTLFLGRFRSGQTNVVVATAVIEEGVDVRSCNLVVKFDFPQTFR